MSYEIKGKHYNSASKYLKELRINKRDKLNSLVSKDDFSRKAFDIIKKSKQARNKDLRFQAKIPIDKKEQTSILSW